MDFNSKQRLGITKPILQLTDSTESVNVVERQKRIKKFHNETSTNLTKLTF